MEMGGAMRSLVNGFASLGIFYCMLLDNVVERKWEMENLKFLLVITKWTVLNEQIRDVQNKEVGGWKDWW